MKGIMSDQRGRKGSQAISQMGWRSDANDFVCDFEIAHRDDRVDILLSSGPQAFSCQPVRRVSVCTGHPAATAHLADSILHSHKPPERPWRRFSEK
jgi:hypothetical protein